MAEFKSLITGRYSPGVEAISNDAPSEAEIRLFAIGGGYRGPRFRCRYYLWAYRRSRSR